MLGVCELGCEDVGEGGRSSYFTLISLASPCEYQREGDELSASQHNILILNEFHGLDMSLRVDPVCGWCSRTIHVVGIFAV